MVTNAKTSLRTTGDLELYFRLFSENKNKSLCNTLHSALAQGGCGLGLASIGGSPPSRHPSDQPRGGRHPEVTVTWEPLGGQCGGGKHGAQLGSWHPIQAGLDLDAPHGLLDALQEGPVLGVLVALPAGAHVGEGAHIGVEVLFTYWLLEDRTRLASPARGGPCPGRPRGSGWGAEGDEATPTQHCLPSAPSPRRLGCGSPAARGAGSGGRQPAPGTLSAARCSPCVEGGCWRGFG